MIDVCLILEGTYPYVAGGVSTWVHQLISAMRDIRFGIVYIAPHSDPTRSSKYTLPPNVIYLKEVYLHDYDLERTAPRRPRARDIEMLKAFYDGVVKSQYTDFNKVVPLFRGSACCFDIQTFFSSMGVWKELEAYYKRFANGVSFIDYFWTWRGTHLPLMQLVRAAIPRARVYHSVSTGYAGLLGAVAKIIYGEKYFLTEHGIYTHERMLEISQATWIYDQERYDFRAEKELPFFKKWWLGIFQMMSAVTYQYADRIFTLYEGNRLREVLEGADAEKITIIPNGIDLHSVELPREKRAAPQIALVGRVVQIKDVKTFIQAARLVLQKIPDAHFYIVGPTDEEREYFEECKLLVDTLHLDQAVTFTGRVNVKEYYQFLDLVVLTSVSEAQPYVILEANVLGIPVVASDVGACREMLEGRGLEDAGIGPSGIVTEVSNPEATADAILDLLRDRVKYERFGVSGKIRVRKYYDQDDLLSRYLNIYEQAL